MGKEDGEEGLTATGWHKGRENIIELEVDALGSTV
jgi:hypothetical protein